MPSTDKPGVCPTRCAINARVANYKWNSGLSPAHYAVITRNNDIQLRRMILKASLLWIQLSRSAPDPTSDRRRQSQT